MQHSPGVVEIRRVKAFPNVKSSRRQVPDLALDPLQPRGPPGCVPLVPGYSRLFLLPDALLFQNERGTPHQPLHLLTVVVVGVAVLEEEGKLCPSVYESWCRWRWTTRNNKNLFFKLAASKFQVWFLLHYDQFFYSYNNTTWGDHGRWLSCCSYHYRFLSGCFSYPEKITANIASDRDDEDVVDFIACYERTNTPKIVFLRSQNRSLCVRYTIQVVLLEDCNRRQLCCSLQMGKDEREIAKLRHYATIGFRRTSQKTPPGSIGMIVFFC